MKAFIPSQATDWIKTPISRKQRARQVDDPQFGADRNMSVQGDHNTRRSRGLGHKFHCLGKSAMRMPINYSTAGAGRGCLPPPARTCW